MTPEQQAARNLKLINILTLIFGFRGFEGVLAVFFATVAGSFTAGMSIFAILNFSSSFFEVPTGLLSDRIGRKKTLLLYYGASVLWVFIFFLAHDMRMLVIGGIIAGFALAMGSGALSAFVYENLQLLGKAHEFKKVEGRREALSRYSIVVACVIGTGVIYLFDIRTEILLTSFVLLCGFFLSMFIVDIKVYENKKANIYADLVSAWRCFVRDPALRDLSIGRILARGAGNAEYRFRALFFAAIMPEWLVNVLGMLNNLITGFAMHAAHAVVDRFGIKRSLTHLTLFVRFVSVPLIMLHTITASFLMNILNSFSFGVREVALEDLKQARYSPAQRATMGSLVGLGDSLMYGVVAITAGVLADQIGVVYTLLILQPVLMLAVYFFNAGITKSQVS